MDNQRQQYIPGPPPPPNQNPMGHLPPPPPRPYPQSNLPPLRPDHTPIMPYHWALSSAYLEQDGSSHGDGQVWVRVYHPPPMTPMSHHPGQNQHLAYGLRQPSHLNIPLPSSERQADPFGHLYSHRRFLWSRRWHSAPRRLFDLFPIRRPLDFRAVGFSFRIKIRRRCSIAQLFLPQSSSTEP